MSTGLSGEKCLYLRITQMFNRVTCIVSVPSPVLQISKWMVKMEWEREESLFISV